MKSLFQGLVHYHKWMMTPKGSAFLYARREVQPLIEPLVVGWGWSGVPEFHTGSRFLDHNQWLGTNDLSAYLAIPAAIRFMEDHAWDRVRADCHALLEGALHEISTLTGLASVYDHAPFAQLAIAPLPRAQDLLALKQRLLGEYKIEIPLIDWQNRHFVRISVQGYNTQADLETLVGALGRLLPELSGGLL